MRYVVYRSAFLVFVVLGVTLITFVITHLIPGDPAQMIAGQRASPEVYEKIRAQLGLDRPIWAQYLVYLRHLLRLDLGTSIRTQQPVLDDLMHYFPATLELVLFAFALALMIGIPLGVYAAIRKDTLIDDVVRLVAVSGISIPVFWYGLVLILVFYGKLGWLPSSGRLDPSIPPPPAVTGMYVIDSLISGRFEALGSALHHLILPGVTLAFAQLALIVKQTRAAMIDVLRQDHIRTARAMGIPSRRLYFRYALKNALIPTVTVVGLAIGSLLAGAVVTETIFSWPGMGKYVVDAIAYLDFPAIMGFTLVVAVGYVIINFVVDWIYTLLDPQIRL